MGYFTTAGLLIVDTLFYLLSFVFLLRVLLQLVGANFYNPICQFFFKATNPILVPLRKLLPPIGRLDVSAVLILLLIQVLHVVVVAGLSGRGLHPLALPILALAGALNILLQVLFWSIIIRIIISFVAADSYHPVVPIMAQITEPVMAPFRRLLPATGGLDFSPLLATLAIMLARILLLAPLYDLAAWVSMG
ncbi:YggT family protein [Pseudomarimonas arenosa]|uniref:YggT family protein n=1 Tax=Pseudomarimonas arenosa TaxID=2774145 RepID=A0AAW3ZMF6_9GAMM|nr:YggT family protein [Pseudomarimonas arenosa]MBD8525581.1 YggT family protein [Pseudomarimonas arenosa]